MNIDRLLDTYYSIDELCELLKEKGYINYRQSSFGGYRQEVVFLQQLSAPVAKFGISLVSKSVVKREYKKYKKQKIMLVDKKDQRISYLQVSEFLKL